MMEMLFGLAIVVVVYFVALYVVVKYTVDKLGAQSGSFGAGLVNIVVGFVLYAIVNEIGLADYGDCYDPPMRYHVYQFGFLAMGLSGIVMVAVDLLKAVNGRRSYVADTSERRNVDSTTGTSVKSIPAPQGHIPTWKRIEMEQKDQNKLETE